VSLSSHERTQLPPNLRNQFSGMCTGYSAISSWMWRPGSSELLCCSWENNPDYLKFLNAASEAELETVRIQGSLASPNAVFV
jgi:hypothetical protein